MALNLSFSVSWLLDLQITTMPGLDHYFKKVIYFLRGSLIFLLDKLHQVKPDQVFQVKNVDLHLVQLIDDHDLEQTQGRATVGILTDSALLSSSVFSWSCTWFCDQFSLDSIEEWDGFAFVFMARNPVILKVLCEDKASSLVRGKEKEKTF